MNMKIFQVTRLERSWTKHQCGDSALYHHYDV